ncbi:uncharacterized protein SCHCODRAFT_02493516 [Schizophyllum commune H4-8]|nr:uncharacterized protein SCHCODRAFT_02493516 [Schizophyllum commune H4-8]KAI5896704.1 hypothetical protein SCHCODRAFT_02493516 [Schizophyllum commune H4-8]
MIPGLLFISLATCDSAEEMASAPTDLVESIINYASKTQRLAPDDPIVTLSSDADIDILVPLATFLLEYPVAYVPNPKHHLFLGQIPLDVHEVILLAGPTLRSSRNVTSHRILKFSVPCHIAAAHPHLAPATLQQTLREVYMQRVQEAFGADFSVSTLHTTTTEDRLAL